MSYEIPQNLKYSEKIVFNLTFPQMIALGIPGILSAIIFTKTALPLEAKGGISIALLLVGAGFAFFSFYVHAKNAQSFLSNTRQAGYLDKKLDSFVEAKRIDHDTIFLQGNEAVAIIEAQPLNFSILSQEHQRAIIMAYRDFLNSLDFPIQIVMRTVDLTLDDYLTALRKRVLESKKELILAQFENFAQHMKNHVQEKAVKNRKFYLIIPTTISREGEEHALNELANRVEHCQQKLKTCNILTTRLDTGQLVPLLASFFDGFVEEGNNYFSPLTVIKTEQKEENAWDNYQKSDKEKRNT